LQRWNELPALQVGLLSQEEAVHFLKNNLPKSKQKSGDLHELAAKLQRLPLALTQVKLTLN